jgi:hypothetical protein
VSNGLRGSKESIYPLATSDECERAFNFVGEIDVGPFSTRMWELVYLLKENDFSAEQITARFIGRAVYQDKYQFAALPPRRRHRAVS